MFHTIRKCRLCGETYEDSPLIGGDGTDIPAKRAMSAVLTEPMPHFCKDGSVGLADFQGYKLIREDVAK